MDGMTVDGSAGGLHSFYALGETVEPCIRRSEDRPGRPPHLQIGHSNACANTLCRVHTGRA